MEDHVLCYQPSCHKCFHFAIAFKYGAIVIMQKSQSKILTAIANVPWYVTNHTLGTDFNVPYVSGFIHARINKHHNNLESPSQFTIKATTTAYKH
jgi:hypothetical protein